jgi:DNA invertase Pin-like site-specific DNA recombinase
LQEALAAAKKNRAILIIAKLDRLGRNVAFISSLMDSRVDFVAVDNPHANRLMLAHASTFAEHEREMISTRTKDALQAAKRNGVVLGKHGKEIESKKNAQAAIDFAESMRPVIEQLKAEGFKTQRAIQDELNSRGIPTFRNNGQKWHQYTVHKILKRLNF